MFEDLARAVADGSVSPLGAVAELVDPDDDTLLALSEEEAQAVIELTQAAVAALHALQALAIEAFVRREDEVLTRLKDDARRAGRRGGVTHIADDVVPSMLAPSLHLAPRTAASFVDDARRLVNGLPRIFALLRAGRLELGRARAIATESEAVAHDLLDTFDRDLATSGLPTPDPVEGGEPEESEVTRRRPRYRIPLVDLTTAGARKRAARTALRVDPEAADRRSKEASTTRYVRVTPGDDPGVTTWSASQSSGESLKAWAAIDALATTYLSENSGLSVGEARADALTDLILSNATVTTSIDLVVPAPVPTPAAATPTTATPDATTPATTTPATTTPAITRGAGDRSAVTTGDAGITGSRGCDCACPIHDFDAELSALDEGDDLRPSKSVAEVVYLGALRRGHSLQLEDTAFAWSNTTARPARPARPADTSPPSLREGDDLGLDHQPVVGITHHQVGIILNEVVSEWLADPDTRIRLHEADPETGQLLRHDPTVYRPGAALSRAVRTRDQHCRFPGCATDVRHCDLDHVIRFPEGQTRLDNLHALCRKHHRFKHSAGWIVSVAPDGTCTWTSPLGRTYVTQPATLHDAAA